MSRRRQPPLAARSSRAPHRYSRLVLQSATNNALSVSQRRPRLCRRQHALIRLRAAAQIFCIDRPERERLPRADVLAHLRQFAPHLLQPYLVSPAQRRFSRPTLWLSHAHIYIYRNSSCKRVSGSKRAPNFTTSSPTSTWRRCSLSSATWPSHVRVCARASCLGARPCGADCRVDCRVPR